MNRVCIFGYHIVNALQGHVVGGAELQMALLANALASHGIDVVVIDREARSSFQYQKNIWIEALPNWDRGIRGLRFITHRVPSLIKCLRNANASVYYVRGCTYLFFIPLFIAKRLHAKFVLAISHDSELWRFRERNKIFYRNNSSLWDWTSTILPNELAFAIIPRCSNVLGPEEHRRRGPDARQPG